MSSSGGIKQIPKEAKHIEQALADIHTICTKHNIWYRVVGSVAFVCAVNTLYRIPADVDVIFDREKETILKEELKKRGYTGSYQSHPFNPILRHQMEDFEKAACIVEPRGGNMTNRGFEYPFAFPLPLIPLNKRPEFSLVFTPTMFEAITYTFGKTEFYGLSREALYIGLKVFMPVLNALGEKATTRQKDFALLSQNLNMTKVEKIMKEKPGFYCGSFPLAAGKHDYLIQIIAAGVKTKRFLRI